MGAELVDRLASVLARRLGLAFDESRRSELADVLERRVAQRGRLAVEMWLAALETNRDELSGLAQVLTVGETYFFRAREQLDALRVVVLPARPASRGPDLRILSAGCSSGEEPYSLAIMLCEWERRGLPASWQRWHVHAIDVSSAALARAEAGVYSEWSLRETPRELRERWFVRRGRSYEVRREPRDAVTFEQRSLFGEDGPLAQPATFDVIFCRNVLMYLTPEAMRAVVSQLTGALVPGGHLFLGHAESLRGGTSELTVESSHGAFYYRRTPEGAQVPAERRQRPTAETVSRPSPSIPAPVAAPTPIAPSRAPTVDDVERLISLERFDLALEALARLDPGGEGGGADLLRAAAHLGAGDLEAAERCCVGLVAGSDPPAEAHVVLALIAEHRGERDKAIEHHRAAVYLDPDVAVSHLHLGRIQRQEGRLAEARHELGQALELLRREPTSRLVLFGGGFSREGLVALCRVELASIGGGA